MRPIYACPENFRDFLATPTATFPEIVLMGFCCDGHMKVRTQFEVHSFTRSRDNRGYFGVGQLFPTSVK